jgi:hypothetical protein
MADNVSSSKEAPPYEDRYIALIDIMGWSSTVRKSEKDEAARLAVHRAARAISQLSESAANVNAVKFPEEEHFPPSDIRVSYFSDTVVVSLPISTTAALYMMAFLRPLCEVLLNDGHYMRGAIVRGPVHHSARALYGPAVVDAHLLESKTAVYPRVLITPNAVEAFDDVGDMKIDADGLTFLNVLFAYNPSPAYIDWLIERRAFVKKNEKADASCLHLVAKHRWFKKYISNVLREAKKQAAAKSTQPSFSEVVAKAIEHAQQQLTPTKQALPGGGTNE